MGKPGRNSPSASRRIANLIDVRRWLLLSRSIGRHAFKIELLTVTHTQEMADYWEQYFMTRFDSIKAGYNIREAGSRGRHSEETKQKIRASNLGKKRSEETRKRCAEAQRGNRNRAKLSILQRKELVDSFGIRQSSVQKIIINHTNAQTHQCSTIKETK